MLELLALQLLVQMFDKKKDTKDALHQTGYNLTMTLSPDDFKRVRDDIGKAVNTAGEKMIGRLSEIDKKLGEMKPDPHTGGYQVSAWSDDASFTGMLIDGHNFPDPENAGSQMVIKQNVKCLCQMRVLKKKDGTSELILNPLVVDSVGLTPEKVTKPASKK